MPAWQAQGPEFQPLYHQNKEKIINIKGYEECQKKRQGYYFSLSKIIKNPDFQFSWDSYLQRQNRAAISLMSQDRASVFFT
jgi:hypothetical protein